MGVRNSDKLSRSKVQILTTRIRIPNFDSFDTAPQSRVVHTTFVFQLLQNYWTSNILSKCRHVPKDVWKLYLIRFLCFEALLKIRQIYLTLWFVVIHEQSGWSRVFRTLILLLTSTFRQSLLLAKVTNSFASIQQTALLTQSWICRDFAVSWSYFDESLQKNVRWRKSLLELINMN